MRLIFFSLVIVNLAMFAWGLVLKSNSPVPDTAAIDVNYDKYPEVRLLSELSSKPAVIADAPAEHLDTSSASLNNQPSSARENAEPRSADLALQKEARQPLCEMVGPFESGDAAASFIERLKAIDVASALRELELPAGPGYWVYLTPLNSRKDALRLLAELQQKQIDSYIIPKGELENGISLGMFSKKNLANARVEQAKSLGYAPVMEEVERSHRELWVMLEHGEEEKMSQLSWQRVMEEINMLERRENYCLDVASP